MSTKANNILSLFWQNIIPGILIHLVLMPIWIFSHYSFDWLVSLTGIVVNVIILPIALFIINYRFNLKHNRYGFVFNILFMLIAMVIWNFFDYLNWGISHNKGLVLNPDIETITIFKLMVFANFITIIIGSLILGLILFVKKKRMNNLSS